MRSQAHAPTNQSPVVIKFLDVAVEFDCAVVAVQRVSVVLLQEVHTPQGKVGKSLLAVAVDGRSEELRGFGEVATRGSKGS